MFTETKLVKKARHTAEDLLKNLDNQTYSYHNLAHTQSVAAAVVEIGEASRVSEEEMEVLLVAAWFHDTGFLKDPTHHEEHSVAYASSFLAEHHATQAFTDQVTGCILATRMPQNPKTPLEQIICDADLYKLGTKDFFEHTKCLKDELVCRFSKDIDKLHWEMNNLTFLSSHQYFTPYAQEHLQPRKDKNIKKIKKRLKQELEQEEQAPTDLKATKEKEKETDKKSEKEKDTKFGRGVETMFRTTSSNHLQLSGIADQKANIMISVNAIIVSLLISVLFRKFEEFPNLIIPTAILVTSCLVAIVFAILATIPNVNSGRFTPDDVVKQRTNLLFFGNFHKMELKEYEWGMNQLLQDPTLLYTSMIQDIYFLGRVLGRKYRLIRISYAIFMFGFVSAVIAFSVALIFFPVNTD
jgi:predicted metal-dependent HD superfamily phosphohydrolase